MILGAFPCMAFKSVFHDSQSKMNKLNKTKIVAEEFKAVISLDKTKGK